jgi:degradative hydroxymethylglutaryl-CoA reductase
MDIQVANSMVENCISRHNTPVGVATNFIVDGREILIPMATEEPSVIAGASFGAKLARSAGGFVTKAGCNVCSGQIVFIPPDSSGVHIRRLEAISAKIIEIANSTMPAMVERTGGVDSLEVRQVDGDSGPMLVVDLHVKVGDSMGANCVIRACEAIKTYVGQTLQYEPLMGILSNLTRKRIVHAEGRWKISDLSCQGYDEREVAKRIIMAANFAKADPLRASTHRKGIMNGISAVVLATGNDCRAVESAVHSYAALPDVNPALTTYRIENDVDLVGEIAVPIPVGIVGGSVKRDKSVEILRKLMKVETADDLARIIAAVGLCQNFAALRGLVTQGIGPGHMKLHSRNIAVEAGALNDEVDEVAKRLAASGSVSVSAAKVILNELRSG